MSAHARVRKPKQLPVLGVAFDFTWDLASMPADSKEDFGETIDEERRICINSPKHKTADSLERTVLHELVHACLVVSGQGEHLDEKTEEGVVIALENGLYPALLELVELGYFRKPKESPT